jgi:hypothetical protein
MQKKAAMMGIKVDKGQALETILAAMGDDDEVADPDEENPEDEGMMRECLHSISKANYVDRCR